LGESLGFISVETRQSQLWLKMSKRMRSKILNIGSQKPISKNTGDSIIAIQKEIQIEDKIEETIASKGKHGLLKITHPISVKDITTVISETQSEASSKKLKPTSFEQSLKTEDVATDDHISCGCFPWFRRRR
jgi:hypothetical protein